MIFNDKLTRLLVNENTAMNTVELEQYLDLLLTPALINDYCPNGLQVEGNKTIKRIVTGVTASQALIDAAIARNADAILVHHGFFWKNEAYVLRGMKYQRIKALIEHSINLFAYHLPLDVHGQLGNNAQLAKLLGITEVQPLAGVTPEGIVMTGKLAKPNSAEQVTQLLSDNLQRQCLHIAAPSAKAISSLAWCTGGGQSYIEQAAQRGIDAFITGEASEQTTHIAHEMDIHFFAAGHHATERYGIKALGEHIAAQFDISVEFVDIDNPI
jgi:dinuclear metal center YbgI/SA1388 family protein